MSDYFYLDSAKATLTTDNMLEWDIPESRFRNKGDYKKMYVTVQQVQFLIDIGDNVYDQFTSAELITNLTLMNLYVESSLNVISLLDIEYFSDSVDSYLRTTTCTPNYTVKYQTHMTSKIQFGLSILTGIYAFNKDTTDLFSILLKFEYEY